MKSIKALYTTLVAALVVLLLAVPASAQQLRNRVVPICTDVTDTATAREAGFIPCGWYQTGTAAATPGYVRVVDRTTNLVLDVETLGTILTSLGVAHSASLTASVLMAMDTATTTTFEALTLSVPATDNLTAIWGLNVNSALYAFDATLNRVARLRMDVSADDLTAGQRGLYTLSILTGYDTAGGNRDRIHSGWFPANFSTTSNGLKVMSGGYWWDTENNFFIYDQGETTDGTDIAAVEKAAYRFALNYVWDGVDWKPTGADANGDLMVNQSTSAVGYGRLQGGDSTELADVLSAHADGLTLTLNGLSVSAVMMLHNGATLDMGRSGATGGLQAEIVNWPNAYDPGNAWVVGMKKETAAVTPAKTTTTVDELEDVLASREIVHDPNYTVCVDNTGAAALTALNIEVSPDGVMWVALTTAPGAGYAGVRANSWSVTLAAGLMGCYSVSGNSDRYLRVQANCGTTTTIEAWYTANKN